MFKKDDVVERIEGDLEGLFKSHMVYIVEAMEGTEFIKLRGMEGLYRADRFKLVSYNKEPRRNQTLSDLSSVEQALLVIDHWNRSHPLAAMVSIEAHPAQDGGSVFISGDTDSNCVEDFVRSLSKYLNEQERKSELTRLRDLLDSEISGR